MNFADCKISWGCFTLFEEERRSVKNMDCEETGNICCALVLMQSGPDFRRTFERGRRCLRSQREEHVGIQ